MTADPIRSVTPLGFPWQTLDPFLFCVHHDDAYPAGNDRLGPAASLAGRQIGSDFAGKDGWRMYHGQVVPGFPQHPHRGFETVTVARRGLIDHSDSLGAAARFGRGDAQWMTAGAGVVHSEMFPLLDRDAPNPVELFQIWLNLPSADKFAPPHFAIFWDETIPRRTFRDPAGRATDLMLLAGSLDDAKAPTPPPRSWAARPESDVAIWTVRMEKGATWTLPHTGPGVNRMVYFFDGSSVRIADRIIGPRSAVEVDATVDLPIEAVDACELLVLQGRPIGEPVVQYGPFVMNTNAEIQKAMLEYRRTQFGGWPWSSDDPVHPREQGRFARHADGRIEHPWQSETPTTDGVSGARDGAAQATEGA